MINRQALRPLPRLTLILGGARSGKSTYALQLARAHGGRVLFVATATAGDAEMAARIARHQAERPPSWGTRELPQGVGQALLADPPQADVLLLDDLTLLVSNVLLTALDDPTATDAQRQAEAMVGAEIDALRRAQQTLPLAWIVVSNEVGLGLVPPTPVGRLYRDVLGRANQQLAAAADTVVLMVAGLPLFLKEANHG